MKRNHIYSISLILLLITVCCKQGYAQVSISGPSCVNMATTYQYIISGTPAAATSIEVCINGGVIATTDSSCYNGVPVPFVRVKWNSLSSGSITVSVNGTNASLTATVCDVLKTGKIDSASGMQIIR